MIEFIQEMNPVASAIGVLGGLLTVSVVMNMFRAGKIKRMEETISLLEKMVSESMKE